MRRRMTSMAWVTARRVRSVRPASVSVSWIVPSGRSATSRVWPPACATMALEIGWDSSRSLGKALARLAGSEMRTWTPRGITWMPPSGVTLASRRVRRTSSRRPVVCERIRSVWSISRRICEPPWRSRPSTMARWGTIQLGNQPGSEAMKPLRCSAEKKLGTARLRPIRMTASVATILVLEKRSIRLSRFFLWCRCLHRPLQAESQAVCRGADHRFRTTFHGIRLTPL